MNSNEEAIFQIIKNNFGYDAESSDFIYKQLYDRTIDKFIRDLFTSAPDGRIRIKIDNKYKESIDEGWKLMNGFFPNFIDEYSVSYDDFIENRVLIGKNIMKLKKAITNHTLDRAVYKFKNKEYDFGSSIKYSTVFYDEEENRKYIVITFSVGSGFKSSILTAKGPNEGFTSIQFVDISDIIFKKKMSRVNSPDIICYSVITNNSKIKFSNKTISRYVIAKMENNVSLFVSSGSNLNFNFLADFTDEKIITLLKKAKSITSYDINDTIHVVVSTDEGISAFSFNTLADAILTSEIVTLNIEGVKKGATIFCSIKNETVSLNINNEAFFTEYRSNDGVNFKEFSKNKKETNEKVVGSYEGINTLVKNNSTVSLVSTSEDNLRKSLLPKIDKDITEKFETVGAKSLPKNRQLEIVLTMNFADWFLCSTGENWTSCLNLESHHTSCHYQGLPGLLGDPNRIMIYVTDGTMKMYEGIQSEKMFSRAWALLDKSNIFNIIKFYPLELLEPRDLRDITKELGLSFKFMELDFISKNSIAPIFFDYPRNNKIKFSSFIFQDRSTFKLNKDKIFIVGSPSNSYYTVAKDNETSNMKVKNISLFHFDGGTRSLIQGGTKLTNYFKMLGDMFLTCAHCGCELDGNRDRIHSYDGRHYCQSCSRKLFFGCQVCGETHLVSTATEIDGRIVCERCRDRYKTVCHVCGKVHIKRHECYQGEGIYDICNECRDRIIEGEVAKYFVHTRCEACGTLFLDKKSEEVNGDKAKGRVRCKVCPEKRRAKPDNAPWNNSIGSRLVHIEDPVDISIRPPSSWDNATMIPMSMPSIRTAATTNEVFGQYVSLSSAAVSNYFDVHYSELEENTDDDDYDDDNNDYDDDDDNEEEV